MKRQEFPYTPAMIGDPGEYRRRPRDRHPTRGRLCPLRTLVRCAEVVNGPHQVHAVPERAGMARQGTAPVCQRRQPLAKRRIEALGVGRVDNPTALRRMSERLDLCGRTLHAAASPPGMRSPHGRLLDQQSRIAVVTKRAAPLKTHSQQDCEASDLAENGLGGTVGSRGGPPARSRPSAGCKTRSISLGAAVDRTMLVPIDLVPGPIPAVPLRRGRKGHGLDHDIIADS
jgi:hypothetical protein